jgi:hypothetical protein
LPKGTAKQWAKETKDIKKLPDKLGEPQMPDLPPIFNQSGKDAPWTQGVSGPDGFSKTSGFIKGFLKTATINVGKTLRYGPTITKNIAGTTDRAMSKYNNKVLSRMKGVAEAAPATTPPKPAFNPGTPAPYKEFLSKYMKKQGSWNLADDAAQESNLCGSQDVMSSGASLRATAETGQTKGKNYRTQGVLNENREFGKQYKRTAQTSRGGKHYGGTILEGFSQDGNEGRILPRR